MDLTSGSVTALDCPVKPNMKRRRPKLAPFLHSSLEDSLNSRFRVAGHVLEL